ncbi:MAG: M48 family metalloprotease [Candidatus Omnitrophica bacterium]|nr:M48 family metalloprotease [Candidatus Omnitrophota bacterium]
MINRKKFFQFSAIFFILKRGHFFCLLTVLPGPCLFLNGCITTEYNLATGEEEFYLISTDKEVNIGANIDYSISRRYTFVTDVDVTRRIDRVLNRLVAVCDRKDIVYFIKVIDNDSVNAVSLPGGYIYIFKELYDKFETDDQLASVIAHELAHITARHGVKRMQASYGSMFLQILSTQANGQVAQGANIALNSLFFAHSQKDEFAADRLGVKYMKKAGYDETEFVKVLEMLKEESEKSQLRRFSYWKTHPGASKRIAAVNAFMKGSMEFKEYIQLIEGEYQ